MTSLVTCDRYIRWWYIFHLSFAAVHFRHYEWLPPKIKLLKLFSPGDSMKLRCRLFSGFYIQYLHYCDIWSAHYWCDIFIHAYRNSRISYDHARWHWAASTAQLLHGRVTLDTHDASVMASTPPIHNSNFIAGHTKYYIAANSHCLSLYPRQYAVFSMLLIFAARGTSMS